MVGKLLKFFDLKERQIADNHTRLKILIEEQGFPPGFWTGPNTHVWREEEVEAWLSACPTERPKPRIKRSLDREGRRHAPVP